jgi:hypothetical protein
MAPLRLAIAIGIGISLAAAAAGADPALDRLESGLPPGWTLLVTGSELVLRHDRPCYLSGARRDNAAPTSDAGGASGASGAREGPSVAGGGPLVTIELRYRLEPRWTAQQIAAGRAANDRIAGELRTIASRYRIDAIHGSKGRPQPTTVDERARLHAYEAARSRLTARLVPLPRCTLGEVSVFDGSDTYAQLALRVDPPEAMTEAHRVVELMKQHCR